MPKKVRWIAASCLILGTAVIAVGVAVFMTGADSLAHHAHYGTLKGASRQYVQKKYGAPIHVFTQTGPPSVDVYSYQGSMVTVFQITIDNTTNKVISVTRVD